MQGKNKSFSMQMYTNISIHKDSDILTIRTWMDEKNKKNVKKVFD